MLLSQADSSIVQGNIIRSNGEAGIKFADSSDNLIGGTEAGAANLVEGNGTRGVHIFSLGVPTLRNSILHNRIAGNGGVGIDLASDGVTPNDEEEEDADTGINDFQNFPAISSVVDLGAATRVSGVLRSKPLADFTLEFYGNSACDESNYGEGEFLIGSTVVTTSALGEAFFSRDLPSELPSGWAVTATATDADGNTSEFSKCSAQLAFDLTTSADGGKMYWTDAGSNRIQRSDLNGGNVEDLVTTGLDVPAGIALDVAGGRMYWLDRGTNKVQRANLDGSDVQDLVTVGLSEPSGITLDLVNGRVYWSDFGTGKIQRANLDGSAAEDVVTGLTDPVGVALDIPNQLLYWTDITTGQINVVGTSTPFAVVVDGLAAPTGVGLDIAGETIYWSDFVANKIQRASASTGVQDLVSSGLVDPLGIELDLEVGKVYWADGGAGRIQRSNLDGSDVQDAVVAGLIAPQAVALDRTADGDGDGCSDRRELGPNRLAGGDRDPLDFWDFYDVTGDAAIDIADTIAILQKFGLGPGATGYDPLFDRYAPDPAKLWRTAAAVGPHVGIDIADAIVNLQSFGHSCA